MLKNKITFCATSENMVDVWPHPQPAVKFIPDSYKKLEKFKERSINYGHSICMNQSWNKDVRHKYMNIDKLSDIMTRVFG